jgi:DNA-binding GntR family transcriptional regulator
MSALSSEVADIVGRAITSRRLVAGAKISERELGEALGVSRIVARQSLIRLADDGLVTIEKNRGAFVAKPSQKETFELFDALTVIEQGVAFSVMSETNGRAWKALKDHVALEAAAADTVTADEEHNLAADFHTLFVALSRNRTLIDLHATLVRRSLSLTSLYQWGHEGCSFLQDHAQLMAQMEKKELGPAMETIARHYQHIVRYYNFEVEEENSQFTLAQALTPFLKKIRG